MGVLYCYETLSVTPREEHRLRMFKKMVLRKVFEPKTVQVAGNW